VISVDATAGTSVVELRTGTRVLARGTSVAAGQNAFLVDGQVTGPAPDLPQYDFKV